MNRYHCRDCDKTVERESEDLWILSWCEVTGRFTRLDRVEEEA